MLNIMQMFLRRRAEDKSKRSLFSFFKTVINSAFGHFGRDALCAEFLISCIEKDVLLNDSGKLAFPDEARNGAVQNRLNVCAGSKSVRNMFFGTKFAASAVDESEKYSSVIARSIHTSTGKASACPRENKRMQSATFGPTPGNVKSSFRASAVGSDRSFSRS